MNKIVILVFLAAFLHAEQEDTNSPVGFASREEIGLSDSNFDGLFDDKGIINTKLFDFPVVWLTIQLTRILPKINKSLSNLQNQIIELTSKMNRPVVSTIPSLEEVTQVGDTAKADVIVPGVLDAGGIHVSTGYWSGESSDLSISASGVIYAGGEIKSNGKGLFFGGLQVGNDLSLGAVSDFYGNIKIIGSENKLNVDGGADILGDITLGVSGKTLTINSSATFKSAMSMDSKRIVSLGTPTQSTDAATKGYVDSYFTNTITILTVSQSGNNIVLTPVKIKADSIVDGAFQPMTLSTSKLIYDVRYVDGANGSLIKTELTALVINAASSNDVEIIATKEVQSVTP